MNMKSYFDFELRTALVYTIAAIAAGYASFWMNHTTIATLVAAVIGVAATLAMRAVWKIKEDRRWWLGNGGVVYIFVWIIVWTLLYNVYAL